MLITEDLKSTSKDTTTTTFDYTSVKRGADNTYDCSVEAYDLWLRDVWKQCNDAPNNETCVAQDLLRDMPLADPHVCGWNYVSSGSTLVANTVFEETRQFDSVWCTDVDQSTQFFSAEEAMTLVAHPRTRTCHT